MDHGGRYRNWQRRFHSADEYADNSSSGHNKWPLQRSNLFQKNGQNYRILLTKKITSWFLFVFTVGDFEKSVRAALTIFSLYVCLFSGLSTWSDHPVWRFKTIKKSPLALFNLFQFWLSAIWSARSTNKTKLLIGCFLNSHQNGECWLVEIIWSDYPPWVTRR